MATHFFSCGFGPRYGGYAVGYTIYNTDGSVAHSRTTSGVYELRSGTGDYGVNATLPDNFVGFIEWDTGDDPARYLHEDINLVSGGSSLSAADVWAYPIKTVNGIEDDGYNTIVEATSATLDARGITTQKISNLDAPVSSRATPVQVYTAEMSALQDTGLTSAQVAKLSHLDADVSSRNATAPDNASIAAIKAKTDHLPATPAATGDTMKVDLTQIIPTNNGVNTLGEALQGARAQAFGTWKILAGELHIYAADNVTILKTFVLDNPASPTRRIAS